MSEKTIYDLVSRIATEHADSVAYRFKKDDAWQPVTWAEHLQQARRIARGLLALGVTRGDKINLLSQSRLEWVQIDIAAASIGGAAVGIYHSNLPPDCAYIVNHSDAVVLFVEDLEQLAKIREVREDLKHLQHVVLVDGEPDPGENVLSWNSFLEGGESVGEDALNERIRKVQPEDTASLVYTSGTTGLPKGVVLTHHNLLFTSDSVSKCLSLDPGDETILFLPLAHVFARIVVYFCMRRAVTLCFAESIEKVVQNIGEVKPHFFASVPRIYEKFHEKVLGGVATAPPLRQKIFNWALKTGTEVSRRQQKKQSVPPLLSLKYAIATRLVLGKIQNALGGRIRWTISGAAPLNPEIAEFFHACGILILEGIGMTENSSFTNVNRVDDYKFGTVGPVGPGIEQKIAEDGEVLFRGDNVMKEYYKNEEATKETIDADGWLHTGDIGSIDEDGFLKITDRKKDLIITAGGKNVAPQRIEKIMQTSRFFSQILVYGDRKKFLTAAVTLDQEQVEAWATAQGLDFESWEALCEHPELQKLVDAEIDAKNKQLASFETIKKACILPSDFSIESGELTPTMKMKRRVVTDKYRDRLEALYGNKT